MIQETEGGNSLRPNFMIAGLLALVVAFSGCSSARGLTTAVKGGHAPQTPAAAGMPAAHPSPGVTAAEPPSRAVVPGVVAATVEQAPPPANMATPSPSPSRSAGPQPPVIASVSFHRQQDPDWCDPADLQMWMESLGVALPGANDHEIQQAIWDYELSHNDAYVLAEWNASPYAVAAAFEHFSGRVAGDPAVPSADDAGVILSHSLAVDHQPAIVMVGHGTHYILVTGVTLGPGGASAPPSEVTVVDSLAPGDNPINAGSGGTSTYSWEAFTSELFTVVQQRPGPWEDHWIVIAAGGPTIQ